MEAEVESYMKQMTLQRFLVLLVSTAGIKGTLAVVGAWALHLDAFGGFHVSLPDAALALAAVSPIIAIDAALMLPEWRPTWEAPGPGEVRTPPPEVRVLSSAAEGGGVPLGALEGADPDAVARVSPAIVARAPPQGLLASAQDAAALFQRKKVTDNPAEGMAVWQEAVLILVGHLSEEMAQRAVLLSALSAWVRDRGLEADFDPVRIDTYAPWVALAATLIFGAGLQKDALTRSLEVRAAVLNRDKRTGKTKVTQINNASLDAGAYFRKADVCFFRLPSSYAHAHAHATFSRAEISTGVAPPGVSPAATAAAATAVARLQAQVRAARERAQSVAQLDAVRNLADEAALGAAFIMTHNLFASFVAACVSDALFSGYQRLGAYRLRKQQQARWSKASSVLRAKALAAARRRKASRAAAAAATAKEGDAEASAGSDDEDDGVLALDLQDDASFGEVTEEDLAEAEAAADKKEPK
jgi:hypothetical protein